MALLEWTQKKIKNMDLAKLSALVLAIVKPRFKKSRKKL